mmetsp:Transcript_37968/g.34005  ORF Transcript_37968/g.34005 Transcript_37968/m.34005 type:complete len:102 (+) Transcript_37968:27-332(+)
MSEQEVQEESKGQKGGGQTDEDLTTISEEIYEKLKLLNYEKEMLSHKGFKPITKAYFAVSLNPNEQFTYFKTLAKFLLSLNEVQTGDLAKYDDPMSVSGKI